MVRAVERVWTCMQKVTLRIHEEPYRPITLPAPSSSQPRSLRYLKSSSPSPTPNKQLSPNALYVLITIAIIPFFACYAHYSYCYFYYYCYCYDYSCYYLYILFLFLLVLLVLLLTSQTLRLKRDPLSARFRTSKPFALNPEPIETCR